MPHAILRNRLKQRVHRNEYSGAGNKGLFFNDGTECTDPAQAADTVLACIPAPGPHHPTWYVVDPTSGLCMDDLFHGFCPWSGSTLYEFFEALKFGEIEGFEPKDFTLSRFNTVTNRRDERARYFIEDPQRLCIESRFTNRYVHPAKREDF